MPPANYPTTLPNVQMDDYAFKPGNTNIRTEMETGLAKVRRRFISAPTEIKVVWQFTIAQLAIFEKFYEVDCLNGANWFYISLVNGMGQTTYLARFKDTYEAKASHREFGWSVSATLEVLTRPLPT
jgi:hypothetical protein